MTISATPRPKPYPEVNGDEIALGDGSSIGHLQVFIWARRKDDPTYHWQTPLQKKLIARLGELLESDPACQELLRALDADARKSREWEAQRRTAA